MDSQNGHRVCWKVTILTEKKEIITSLLDTRSRDEFQDV